MAFSGALSTTGVNMPSIAIRELDGSVRLVREFGYEDYASSLS